VDRKINGVILLWTSFPSHRPWNSGVNLAGILGDAGWIQKALLGVMCGDGVTLPTGPGNGYAPSPGKIEFSA